MIEATTTTLRIAAAAAVLAMTGCANQGPYAGSTPGSSTASTSGTGAASTLGDTNMELGGLYGAPTGTTYGTAGPALQTMTSGTGSPSTFDESNIEPGALYGAPIYGGSSTNRQSRQDVGR
jgi:hypothetical protein